MTGARFMVLLGAVLVLVAIGGRAASADVIDGNWCSADGRTMTINGPRIVTPGGTAMTGDYDRHGFAYIVPASEPAAGAKVVMRLLNELNVRVTTGEKTETWHRCSPAV